ncbi:hypothetical protein [Nocardia brasiliensis]|uniref:hypothetical protein n=1 Tax=Nocardia brasiliensis TaxID=37326 RepID=UPI003D8C7E0E
MSKNGRVNYRRAEKGRNRPNRPERRITVRGIRKSPPDLRPLGRAAITAMLAEAQAEQADAAAGGDEDGYSPSPADATTAGLAIQQEVADDE